MEPIGTSSGCCEAVWSRFHPVRFDLNQALMVSLESGGALEIYHQMKNGALFHD
jgi:hypothetical protein